MSFVFHPPTCSNSKGVCGTSVYTAQVQDLLKLAWNRHLSVCVKLCSGMCTAVLSRRYRHSQLHDKSLVDLCNYSSTRQLPCIHNIAIVRLCLWQSSNYYQYWHGWRCSSLKQTVALFYQLQKDGMLPCKQLT